MKYVVIALFLLSASAKAQEAVYARITFKPDTFLVVRNISNEMRSTWWRQVDHSPWPCKLKEIIEVNKPPRYLKKMRHGWEPIPAYYKVWEF